MGGGRKNNTGTKAGRDAQAQAQANADPSTLEGAKIATGATAPTSKEKQASAQKLAEFIYHDPKDGGRNLITVDKLQDLKYAFLIGSTVSESCRYAGITEQGYRLWVKNMPTNEMRSEWLELVGKWQDDTVLQARNTIRTSLKDPNTAKWLLERKRRDEYATRVENDVRLTKFDDVPDDTLEGMIGAVTNGTDSTAHKG